MKIVELTTAHIEQAMALHKQNYLTARKSVIDFPEIEVFPDFIQFAQNGLGVAAYSVVRRIDECMLHHR